MVNRIVFITGSWLMMVMLPLVMASMATRSVLLILLVWFPSARFTGIVYPLLIQCTHEINTHLVIQIFPHFHISCIRQLVSKEHPWVVWQDQINVDSYHVVLQTA